MIVSDFYSKNMKKGFRDDFKHFKRKDVPLDFTRVINFSKANDPEFFQKNGVVLVTCKGSDTDWEKTFGMKNPSEWEVYSFLKKPGLLFIKNPFYAVGQRYWITRCLKYFTKKPSKLNIDAHDILKKNEIWWEFCHRENNEHQALTLEKLRWATFGYHHNWDTKVYSEASKCEFPPDLKTFCSFLAQTLNFSDFNAEAAIINFYHFGSSLSGHTDHSEINVKAPLFSFSFGQSAVFLIGGKSLEDETLSILLQSGDIIVMSEESRLCYHGVPRIVPDERESWNADIENINRDFHSKYYIEEVIEKLWDNQTWETFDSYVKKSRINMNVRQVLLPGHKTLEKF